jgi:hypothetical protein
MQRADISITALSISENDTGDSEGTADPAEDLDEGEEINQSR